MKFAVVTDDLRVGSHSRGKYDELFKALQEGQTIKIPITEFSAKHEIGTMRKAWLVRYPQVPLHLVRSGDGYVAWIDKEIRS